jgi:hypothetical protein
MANLTPGRPSLFDRARYRPAGLRIVKSSTSVRLDWVDGSRSNEVVVELVPPRPDEAT